jgi:hypothetical protein
MSLSVYHEDSKACDSRSNLFSAVCIHAQMRFSMPPQRLDLCLFCMKQPSFELFSEWRILNVADVGCRLLNSARVDVAFFLYGMDGHGK